MIDLLAAPSRTVQITGDKPSLVLRFWEAIGLWGRIGVIGLGVVLVGVLVFLGLRALGRKGRRQLLWAITGLALLGVAGLGYWTSTLPTGRVFVLSHQFVRAGFALSVVLTVIGVMALAIPWVLDLIERAGFVPFVATRHVRASKSGFLTAISLLSILGVGVSACALCVVVSVMGGFGADLKRKILGNNAHIRIEAKNASGFQHWRELLDQVRGAPGVKAATPVAGGEVMASSATNTAGVLLRGVDTSSIGDVIELKQNIEVGKFEYLEKPEQLANLPDDEPIGLGPGGEIYRKGPNFKAKSHSKLDPDVSAVVVPEDAYPGIVLGRELAKTLHVYVGDEITLVSPLGDLGPMGVLPRSRKFRVAAVFYSEMYEYDANYAYVTRDVAQRFLDLEGAISAIDIRVGDAEHVDVVRPNIEVLVRDRDELRVRDWKELNRNLFSALKLERIATFVILSIATLVASFCIICTLLLMVTEKSKEIAILKAIGASDGNILRIFMLEGLLIGGIGTAFGVATGYAIAESLRRVGISLDPDVYYITRLPVSVDRVDFVIVAVSAIAITTLATLYPALAASRLRPVEGIRYE